MDHQRIVADGSAKIVMVSGSGLSKSRDSFQVVDRATGCSGSSAVAGSSAVVDSSSGASENGQLRVQVTLDVGTAEEVKLCVRYGGGAADEWYGFEPSTGGDLVAVSVSGFTADVVPVLPDLLSAAITLSGQQLSPLDTVVVVSSVTPCSGCFMESVDGISVYHSSGVLGGPQSFSVQTTGFDASVATVLKLCIRPGVGEAQFGEVAGSQALSLGGFSRCVLFSLALMFGALIASFCACIFYLCTFRFFSCSSSYLSECEPSCCGWDQQASGCQWFQVV